ncbi:BQ5605_C009g05464 [Microbotryum silenes-dioicae]|uniref:BQ5605_C009g05464 protein n=1 Tax=Microbotryum silenes-dioicae TaxID=796604 RepID=A0A2X0MDH6_9BASI|nr:BQ5605_C009g05464 [Microbotryum silenes-dioicae]
MAAPLYTTDSGRLYHAGQILLAFVGLPARGKTHVSRSVERYLRWLGVKIEGEHHYHTINSMSVRLTPALPTVFSLGDHRRRVLGPSAKLPKDYFYTEGRCAETEQLRSRVKDSLETEIISFFNQRNGQVAIYDANNGKRSMRIAIRQKFEKLGVSVIFIENICDRADIVESNIRSVKISSPDYAGWDQEKAVADYLSRIAQHERHYETLRPEIGAYVKIYNVGERLVVNNVRGYLQSRIVFYLMNVHHKKRTIWFARSGHSLIEHSYKADADLSPQGIEYAENLRSFIVSKRAELLQERVKAGERATERRLTIWTSARNRCLSTCRPLQEIGYKVIERQQMYELNPGVIDGMEPDEIKKMFPDEFKAHQLAPYSHRYPRAESYHDLSVRLEPVILELEREPADILFIGHASVIRCVMAYLQGLTPQEIPNVELRRGDVVQVSPSSYGVELTTHFIWQA